MKDRMIDFCRRLIQIPSISGQEQGVAELIAQEMKALGFDRVWIDKYGSVIGMVQGTGGGKAVLFDGHIDTVPVSDSHQWTKEPFGGELSEGRIYGRGASDMKGAVAAMVYALGAIAQGQERPTGDLYVSGTVQEENFEGVALASILEEVKPEVVIIGEATELRLNIGQRGRGELAVHTYGKSAHSANPQVGINAISKMQPVIKGIEKLKLNSHAVLGQGIGVVTDIISTPYPGSSVVPNHCRITIDRRLLVGETEQRVLAQFEELLDEIKASDPQFSGNVEFVKAEAQCYTGVSIEGLRFFPAWLMDQQGPVVLKAQQAIKEAGLPVVLGTYSFCTNGSQSAGVKGIATLGFGPSRENLAHSVDEYVEVEQLVGALKGYEALARVLSEK
ncbi:YgeY family selenium metabolism-linked hydrolase [Desulforamulus aquiferis]|uniref:YgeY family selenium metabolism-linked hydrolase n=1 Tax=Desulforamulus aquiferis TaxID=1397668 RepID=UPI003570D2AE